MRQVFLCFILIMVSSIVGHTQAKLDLHQVVAEQGGYTLTMDDILVVLMSNQQMGQISLDPTEPEIQSVALITTQQFQMNPALCMQGIQTLRSQFNYYGPEENNNEETLNPEVLQSVENHREAFTRALRVPEHP